MGLGPDLVRCDRSCASSVAGSAIVAIRFRGRFWDGTRSGPGSSRPRRASSVAGSAIVAIRFRGKIWDGTRSGPSSPTRGDCGCFL